MFIQLQTQLRSSYDISNKPFLFDNNIFISYLFQFDFSMAMKPIFVVDNGGYMSKSRMNNTTETKFGKFFGD